MRGLDVRRVLDRAPGKLRERLAVGHDALRLHLETALLRHGRVPDVVCGEKGSVQRDIGGRRELVV